mgnify:CR=1 FL=1
MATMNHITQNQEDELVVQSQVFRVVDEMVEKIMFNNSEDIGAQEALFGESDTDEELSESEDNIPQFLTDRDVVRVLFSDSGEPIGEISRQRNDPVYCSCCNCEETDVNARIETNRGPVDVMTFISANEDPDQREIGSWICTSCSRFMDEGGRFCVCCGLNENLGREYGITFDVDEVEGEICCIHCEDSYPDLYLGVEPHIANQDTDIYDGEFENGDMPENNTEKVKKVKETIGEIGELVFDIQSKLTEGEYLKMMDLLQSVTNGVNSL